MVHRYWWDIYNWWFVFTGHLCLCSNLLGQLSFVPRQMFPLLNMVYGSFWPCFGSGTKSVGKFYKAELHIKKRDKYKLFSVRKL